MNKKILISGGCALVAAVAVYLTIFRASDEDKIEKCLVDFASIVTVKPNDTIISRTARMRSRMSDVVRDDVQVTVPELNVDVRGRDKLEDDAAKIGLAYSDASFTFIHTKIEIDPARTFAKVDTTALVTAKTGDDRKLDKRAIHVLLRKDDGWKIDSMDVSPISN